MMELARVPLQISPMYMKEQAAHWVTHIGAHCTKLGPWTLSVVAAQGSLMDVQVDVQAPSSSNARSTS